MFLEVLYIYQRQIYYCLYCFFTSLFSVFNLFFQFLIFLLETFFFNFLFFFYFYLIKNSRIINRLTIFLYLSILLKRSLKAFLEL